jgi:hypothetical protein
MKSALLFLLSVLITMGTVLAQVAPLPAGPNTIGLWNFDQDVQDSVLDSAPSPLNGTAYSTDHQAVPGIDASFGLARRFHLPSSFVDLGEVTGSKLDFTDASELSIEAVIHLTAPATDNRIIFSTENVRLVIINNQLTGILRQPGGLYGLVSERVLSQNTTYRVGLHVKDRLVLLTINGQIDSKLIFEHPIQAPEFSNSRAFIGGDIFGKYFPGYIDDVRVQDIVGVDVTDPVLELVEPSSFQVESVRPNFKINLSDIGSGINTSSIQVFLNGVAQTGLTISASQILGVMDQDMQPGLLNEVKVLVSDYQGNAIEKKYFFVISMLGDRGEYTTDENTIALWHMNDFAPSSMADSSSNNHHGYADPLSIGVGDGVFSKGKHLKTIDSSFRFDGVRFDKKFTFEGWFRPTSDYGSDEILFYNGQITVSRFNGGFIRVSFHTTGGILHYVSPAIMLPVGELHHLAITWDGERKDGNLLFYLEGNLLNAVNAISQCDFDPIPAVGLLGKYFVGMIDEVRISNNVRNSFNIPTLDNQVITFLTLKNGTSVNEDFPEFSASLNTATTIDVDSVKIKLNGVIQPASADLVVSSTGINGKFFSPVKEGLNELEVEFNDSQGNLRKKSQYFFKVTKAGATQYQPTSETAGLWHFEDDLLDSSSSNAHLTGHPVFEPGYLGLGHGYEVVSDTGISFNCRSYTVEGYFKTNNNQDIDSRLFSLQGGTLSHTVSVNPANGNVRVILNANSVSLDVTASLAMPIDNSYHHVALVHDGSRGFSQMLLVVDGEVKLAQDFKNSCNATEGITFTAGFGDIISFDEIMLSRKAKYSFNIAKPHTDFPEVISQNIEDGINVGSDSIDLSFIAEDTKGINTELTKLFVNGVEQTMQTTGKARLSTSFESSVPLVPGANHFTISLINLEGNQTLKSFFVYRFGQLATGAYTADEFTKFLFHFDEVNEDFADSAGRTESLSYSSWASEVSGAFGQAVSVWANYEPFSFSDVSNLNAYTFEAWVKRTSNTDAILQRNQATLRFSASENLLVYTSETGESFSAPLAVMDEEFHHYALVIDSTNTQKNIYLLVDGTVRGAFKADPSTIVWNESSSVTLASGIYGGSIDEARFSTVARYEFVSTKE